MLELESLTILTVQGLVKSQKMRVSKKKGKGEIRLTKMLIVLSVTFILLRLPSTTVWLIRYVPYRIMKKPLDETYYKLVISHYIFAKVLKSNFATNFIIYIVCLPVFRHHFINIFSCKNGKSSLSKQCSIKYKIWFINILSISVSQTERTWNRLT